MSKRSAFPPALILAAGKGTRLGALGRELPKALVSIGGRPLLDLHLDHLRREGISHVVINAHHQADQICDHVRRYQGALTIRVLVERDLLGTAGAAVNALAALRGDTFFVLYGDVFAFISLSQMLEIHRNSGAVATIAVYEHDDTHDKGVVTIDPGGRITGFAEKDGSTVPGLVNSGFYVLEAELLRGFRPNEFLDFGYDVFPMALREGKKLQAHTLPAPVLDIGTPAALERANELVGRGEQA